MLLSTCVYVSLFETRSSNERLSRPPPPFVLTLESRGGRHLKPGEAFSFGMTLLGPAIPQLPYVIAAWQRAGRVGLGRHGGEFDLVRVQQEVALGSEEWATVYSADSRRIEPAPVRVAALPSPPDEVLIGLDTPLRLRRDGHLVGPSEFRPNHLLRALMWRLSDLQALYAIGGPDIQGDPADWGDPDAALVSSKLHWQDWTRYSSRQKTHMQMGGVMGEVRLAGRTLAPWWPLLWLGQWIHAGKQTSMGLGAYRLRSPASL